MNDAELSKRLIDIVGPSLVALAAGSRNQHVAELWLGGRIAMSNPERQRLDAALECLQTVAESEGAETARAWFIGRNVGTDETSPAEALCEGRLEDVRRSMHRLINDEHAS